MIIHSELQVILETWENSETNILISSCAGSGKTSTLLALLEKSRGIKTMFLAFNKAIELEINDIINDRQLNHGKAFTLHALGLRSLTKHLRSMGKSIKIVKNKQWDIIEELKKQNRRAFSGLDRKEYMSLCYAIMDIDDKLRSDYIKDPDKIIEVIGEAVYPVGRSVMISLILDYIRIRDSEINKQKVSIDFLDMLYMTVDLGATIDADPTYLLMDEVQDFSIIQHLMIDNLINQGDIKKWAAVGDRNQAIYMFAGSSPKSFDLFMEKSNDVIELPLTLCFRCPQYVVNEANEVYPGMVAHKNYPGVVDTITDISKIKDGSMVICRNTRPLVDLYFDLMLLGKSCYINGDEVVGSLLKFLNKYKTSNVRHTLINVKKDLEKSLESDPNSYESHILRSNYEILMRVNNSMGMSGDVSVFELQSTLRSVFTYREDSIMLCTIHKSKGLGRDVVYILNEDLIPSKFARTPEELVQEKNLKYVARTRAQEELYYLEVDSYYY